ncbi:MAG: hypothetical protein KDD29_03030 [Flavobacteriales bacterium]|nr:hypothetical protein [Flavobacteriales bacterium]MCB9336182.1 hypothetical protein [Flavobacteriales bacterium]
MKKLFFIFFIICAATNISAQTSSSLSNLNGKYGFIYNDNKRLVEFITSSNTFIEYDENGNQLTDGTFTKKGDVFILTPIVKTNASQISIPVNFKIVENLPKKIVVVFNSSEVDNKKLNLYKL